jgi:hypothetical protein
MAPVFSTTDAGNTRCGYLSGKTRFLLAKDFAVRAPTAFLPSPPSPLWFQAVSQVLRTETIALPSTQSAALRARPSGVRHRGL